MGQNCKNIPERIIARFVLDNIQTNWRAAQTTKCDPSKSVWHETSLILFFCCTVSRSCAHFLSGFSRVSCFLVALFVTHLWRRSHKSSSSYSVAVDWHTTPVDGSFGQSSIVLPRLTRWIASACSCAFRFRHLIHMLELQKLTDHACSLTDEATGQKKKNQPRAGPTITDRVVERYI